MDNLELIKRKIESIGGLPTLPQIAGEVLSIAGNPSSSMKDLSRVIHRDPALAGKVLKIANSAFYGLRQQVGSLQLAIVVLGLKKITNLVTSVSVFNMFQKDKDDTVFNRVKFWEHSAGTGQVARILARRSGLETDGEEFVGGLLHDLGKIIIDQYFGEQFKEIIELMKNDETLSSEEAEKQVLGAGHSKLGGWLADKWHLPTVLVECVTYHHNPAGASPANRAIVTVVSLANAIAKVKGVGFKSRGTYAEVAAMQEWDILRDSAPTLDVDDVEDFLATIDSEVESVWEFVKIASD